MRAMVGTATYSMREFGRRGESGSVNVIVRINERDQVEVEVSPFGLAAFTQPDDKKNGEFAGQFMIGRRKRNICVRGEFNGLNDGGVQGSFTVGLIRPDRSSSRELAYGTFTLN